MQTPSDDTPDPIQISAYSVDVSLISDDEMAALNRDYRQKNKPTDVLSFSLWEGEVGGEGAPCAPFDGNQEVPLGDLVISLDTAVRQAGELNHSLERELEFLAVHGTLHLLGYDHIRAADRRVMWRRQEEIVNQL